MTRFYLPVLFTVFTLVAAIAEAGQGVSVPEQPWLGTILSADALRQLPANNNAFSMFDTVQTEAIGNRFLAGGLSTATAPSTGGLLNSWTQTTFRIGDVAITDPRSGGTPLVLPVLPFFDRVTVGTAALGVDDASPALSMALVPLTPGTAWVRAVEGSAAGAVLTSDGPTLTPYVDRVNGYVDANAAVAGPLNARTRLAAAASWRALSHVDAPSTIETGDHLATAFAHVVFAATPRDEVRALGFIQGAHADRVSAVQDVRDDLAVHAQATWERREPAKRSWRAFAGYTGRSRTAPLAASMTVDSLNTDPISTVIAGSAGNARRWTAGARLSSPGRFVPSVGADFERASAQYTPSGVTQIRELVNAAPARIWDIHAPSAEDGRHLTRFAAHAIEHIVAGPVTIDGGVAVESLSGSADAGGQGISWTTLLPQALVQWDVTKTAGLSVLGGVRRAGYQLPLDMLAVGDPAAPYADVSRWDVSTTGTSSGALIARVGPGTGGDAALSQIDPNLKRPMTEELVLAVRTRPVAGLDIELARVTKRERSLMALVDTGVPSSAYRAFLVPDPSYDAATAGGFDKPFAAAYDRPAGAYGRDRYVLTNPGLEDGKSWAMLLTVRATRKRFTALGTIALTWADGPAAAIGFRPTQNDQDVLGSAFVDANTLSQSRGQLFQDRSHVGNITFLYAFPRAITLGAIARYQDGQPFSRLVMVPSLTQGAVAVRAFRNGGSAFTHTSTLDVRLQKTFTRGSTGIAVGVDVYNLPGLGYEVSEYVIAGPAYRTPTALQPPRSGVATVRVTF